MEPQEYLNKIAREFYHSIAEEKDAKEKRSELRDEFIRLADDQYSSRDHLLPVQTIEVDNSFFQKTGLTQDEFVSTRFPGWKVEHVEFNSATQKRTFVLKRDPHFLNQVVVVEEGDDKIYVSKEVSEYTPEVDWDTLRLERPDLFERLVKPKVVFELNEDALEQMMDETPEDAAALKRHLKVKPPTIRATARVKK